MQGSFFVSCVPSQWETTLQCSIVSHWLGAYIKQSLHMLCAGKMAHVCDHKAKMSYFIGTRTKWLTFCSQYFKIVSLLRLLRIQLKVNWNVFLGGVSIGWGNGLLLLSHKLNQSGPRSRMPYDITRPQWVNMLCTNINSIWQLWVWQFHHQNRFMKIKIQPLIKHSSLATLFHPTAIHYRKMGHPGQPYRQLCHNLNWETC